MWTRKELKQRGMQCFRLNYWKTVLIALIASVLVGGFESAAATGGGLTISLPSGSHQAQESGTEVSESAPEADDADPEALSPDSPQGSIDELPEEISSFRDEESGPDMAAVIIIAAVGLTVFLVMLAVAILICVFLVYPLEVGTKRYFVTNLHMPAEVKEVAFGYDHGYKNIVKTLFFRDLYTFLWCLLFIAPGIIKSYEYRMIPYILAEHPETSRQEAFAQSRALMKGHKWKAFILDLSFIGWDILSVFTLGLLDIFYVAPYRSMTNAALYEALVYGNRQEETKVWTES